MNLSSKPNNHYRSFLYPFRSRLLTILVSGMGVPFALGQSETERLSKLERENDELKKRFSALEQLAQQEGILSSDGTQKKRVVTALTQTELSGFVSASYFYDTSVPADNSPNGYLWNRRNNQFTLNKFKLTLASPAVERSGEKWDAGYKVSLIFGQDAPFVNTGFEYQSLESLREAYVEFNVPVGTGLDIRAGQLISLLNFESGDGGAVNPNFSQGNQWYFTGNGPSTGIQAGYDITEHVDVKVRIQNGMYTGAIENNGYKTMMGGLGIHPGPKTTVDLIGFGGRETSNSGLWLKGGSLIGTRKLNEKHNINFATEFDYFSNETFTGNNDWWSIGGWLWGDASPKCTLAFRLDYLSDPEGAGTSGLLGFPVNNGQDLTSATFTITYKPTPGLRIQPEIRYDHTSLPGGFDGQTARFMVGAGIIYLF
jgi:hypothetical protein